MPARCPDVNLIKHSFNFVPSKLSVDAIAMVIRKEDFKLFSARVKNPMSRQYS